MIERRFESREDVELLLLWMSAPPNAKPTLPFDAEAYLQRLQLAHQWLQTHMSTRKVWPMLLSHFRAKGVPYSEATARRDVEDAQRVFATMTAHTLRFWTQLMLDSLGELYLSARLAHKFADAARISREIREYLILSERAGIQDAQSLMAPVPRMLVFAPEEAGFDLVPNAKENALAWIEDYKRDHAKASHIEEAKIIEPNGDDPGHGSDQ